MRSILRFPYVSHVPMQGTSDDDFLIYAILFAVMATLYMSANGGSAPQTHPVADGRAWAAEHSYLCKVDGVLSGDEVVCNGGGVVHLIGADAPDRARGDIGKTSLKALGNLVPDSTVLKIELDEVAQDSLGRVPGYLYLPSGHMVNAVVVWNGYAVPRAESENRRHLDQVSAHLPQARAAQRGLWPEQAFQCFASGKAEDDC